MDEPSEERLRLLAVELAALQEEGDVLAHRRKDVGRQDEELEALMLRLGRARERLAQGIGKDRRS